MISGASAFDFIVSHLKEFPTPFSVELPSGEEHKFGDGEPEFRVGLRNERALKALRSLDEANSRRPILPAISISRAIC
jgi:hypothetical protein